jgi:hypothetical protein
MKRLISLFLSAFLIATLSSCGAENNTSDTSNSSDSYAETTQDAAVSTNPADKEWTEEEIASLFASRAESDWNLIDCVCVSDRVFDRIGVVMFVDETSCARLAFMDAEGYYSLCGIEQVSAPSNLTYCGNGVVTFSAKAEDGTMYEYKVTYSKSEDGRDTNFKLASNPQS